MYRIVLFIVLFVSCTTPQIEDIIRQASDLEARGHFSQAQFTLENFMQNNPAMPEKEKDRITFAMERLKRIPIDYNLTEENLISQLREAVEDFSEEDFEKYFQEGRFDYITYEGEKRFHYASRSNLFFRYPDTRARRLNKPDESKFEHDMLEYCRNVKKAGKESDERYILPKRFRSSMHFRVNPDVVPDGKIVRCWLPFPRAYPNQTDIKLVASEPSVQWIDHPLSVSRSLYMERAAQAGIATEFKVQFEYTSWATQLDVNPEKILIYERDKSEYGAYLTEKQPHVVFTPELKKLAQDIVGDEQNPYLKAKRIYDWIGTNIVYSYMIEYSLIDNLAMYAYRNRYGDCGVMGLMFITLCRISGVPARWQGCWMFFPGDKTIHDWTEFYVEPYGWLPCDPYKGVWAEQMTRSLSKKEKEFLKDFYFGNMTAYRMAANAGHCAGLYPIKNSYRSDMVDFQRGEAEWNGHNIYFDQRSFFWKVESLD